MYECFPLSLSRRPRELEWSLLREQVTLCPAAGVEVSLCRSQGLVCGSDSPLALEDSSLLSDDGSAALVILFQAHLI